MKPLETRNTKIPRNQKQQKKHQENLTRNKDPIKSENQKKTKKKQKTQKPKKPKQQKTEKKQKN